MPFLSGEHTELLETEILEVYDKVSLAHNKELLVSLKEFGENATKIDLLDSKGILKKGGERKETKKLNLKLIDMGGHQEYYSCSTL